MLLSQKIGQDLGKFPLTKFSLIMEMVGTASQIHLKHQPKGLYFIILTVMNDGRAAYSWLMRGSSLVAISYGSGAHSVNVGTVSTVLLLDAGEHVYAQHGGGTLGSIRISYTESLLKC